MIEILLVVALIALLAGALTWGAAMWKVERDQSAEDVVWDAIQTTRKEALLSRAEQMLRVNDEGELESLTSSGQRRNFPIPGGGKIKVQLLSSGGKASYSLVGGELMESRPVTFARFYPDGTCSPFRVQIKAGASAQVIAIDPWTCAPVLPTPEGVR